VLPVLYRITFESGFSQAMLYLLAIGIVAYAAWAGYVGAQPPKSQQLTRGAVYGVVAAVFAKMGLSYALPAGALFGGKGEGVPLHTYGLMIAVGFASAVAVAARLARREWPGAEGEKKREQILDMSMWALVGGIGGAKLLFILVNLPDYVGHFSEFFGSPGKLLGALGGGFVFYGGLLGAMGTSYWFARKHDIQWLRLADLCIPTVSLGQCFGRLGCFSAGCCWGEVAGKSVHWAARFPGAGLAKDVFGHLSHTASLVFASQVTDDRWVMVSTGQVFHHPVEGAVRIADWVAQHGTTLPVHPTQLYESVGQLGMFLLLLWMRRYRRFHGQILALWLMGYAVLRSTVELFRGDLERGTLHGLLEQSLGWVSLAARVPAEAWYNISTSQFISLCMFATGAVMIVQHLRRAQVGAPAAPLAAA
jgi:phosphatidylglycerol:prolipoprotein diacylglycerol transferase